MCGEKLLLIPARRAAFLTDLQISLRSNGLPLRDRNSLRPDVSLARAGGGECEIITLGVVPEQRGAGAAATLMRAIIARAGELDTEEMLLEVADDNPAAIALYKSAAFEPVGRRKDYYRDADGAGVDAIVMRRSLLS